MTTPQHSRNIRIQHRFPTHHTHKRFVIFFLFQNLPTKRILLYTRCNTTRSIIVISRSHKYRNRYTERRHQKLSFPIKYIKRKGKKCVLPENSLLFLVRKKCTLTRTSKNNVVGKQQRHNDHDVLR